jgi:hypothetical protein
MLLLFFVGFVVSGLSWMAETARELPVLSYRTYPSFDEYLELFGKHYASGQLEERKAIYDAKVSTIREHN